MPEGDLDVVVRSVRDRLTLALRGEIDLGSAPIVRASLDGAVAESHPVVEVDLAGVTFMDSSGLGALAAAHQALVAAGRQLVVTGAQGTVRRVLSISGLDQAVDVE